MPKRIDYQDKEFYTFRIELPGSILKKLQSRADKNKRNLTNESSFLIIELLSDHFDNDQPFSAPLNGEKWLPKNQSEVTDKTLKIKS